MVRLYTLIVLFLIGHTRTASAQVFPTPWHEAIVGSLRSPAEIFPNARRLTSVSAVRALGDVSILVNTPQVRAERIFRTIGQGEAAYDYLKSAVEEAARDNLHLKVPQGVYSVRVPEGLKVEAHVVLNAVRDVRLDFQNSTIIFQDLNRHGFLLADTRRVTIENATIWWSGFSHVMGTIEGGVGDLRIKIHPDYAPLVQESSLLQQQIQAVLPARRELLHLWDLERYVYEYHNPTEQSDFTYSQSSASYIPKRPGILASFSPGQSVLVQNKKYGANAFHVKGGSDLTINGSTIGNTPGMAFFSSTFERGLAWIDNKIKPVSHPLHLTTTADGIHLRNSTGDFIIQNSTFERTSDDPINIYTGLMEVAAVESETTFLVRARHVTSDRKLIQSGKEVVFVNSGVWPRDRAPILSVEPIGKELLRIQTSRPAPFVKAGDSAFLSERIPRRGGIFSCLFSDVRARAAIVLQATSASVVANTIRFATGPAIISGGFQNWYVEGPLSANVRIRDNLISNVGLAPFYQRFNLRGAISVGTGTKEPPEYQSPGNYQAHWGVAIVRNTITESVAPGIQVQDARTVWIRENEVSYASGEPLVRQPSLEVKNVCGAQIAQNSLASGSRIEDQKCPLP